jgi:pyruvate/2-oxoglutarate dehydrogenase complex dihydrolipoamide dehydrogenase (E3) component
MGVTFTGLSFDWGQMQKAKDDTVSGLTKGIEGLFKKNKVGAAPGVRARQARAPPRSPP